MQASRKAIPAPASRAIRVFISSTFRDMQAERDELTKFVFPQLRKQCEQRGVTWGHVDLRWGITDEQRAEGKVLPICLENIQRCRPYFIGLLGERYGWVPEGIPPELITDQPWLADHLAQSVTELEILHGVLNSPEMADQAFFYLRDPAFVHSLPEEQRADFSEVPSQEEIETHGLEAAGRRAEERRRRLAALKERIRGSGLPVSEDYRDARQLGEWVLRDLTAVIDRLYPEGSPPDPLDREAADHEAFAASRIGVYVGRQIYLDALNKHARDDGPPLVLLGESGSGKSALLANWARQYRADHPAELLIMHFVGASPQSADWAAMLRRILGEFKRHFDIADEIPDQPEALRTAFANWLSLAAARGRLVLILDALNQLEDRDQAPDLIWLPPVISGNVRLILSTLPGRPLAAVDKRGWPRLRIEPLELEERRQLIVDYLARSSKALGPALVERVAAAPQAANPLFLRATLDELSVYGVHVLLESRIEHYLSAASLEELFTRILRRYEEDYERDRPGLVREAFSWVWAARRGLAEVELLDLLGTQNLPLPHAHWAPLSLAAESALVNRGGLIGFFHDHLRQAVEQEYLRSEDARRSAHLKLADYFDGRGLGPRTVEELPWQLARAGAWERLSTLLGDLPFFDAVNRANEFEVRAYWAQIEANSAFRVVDGYHKVMEAPGEHHDHVWDVARLLADMGHPRESLALSDYLTDHFRDSGNWGLLAASIGSQANLLYARGELDEALALHREGGRLCREMRLEGGLALSLVNQGAVLFDRGQLDTAFESCKEAEGLFRRQAQLGKDHLKLTYQRGLAKSLTGQANVLNARGSSDAALALHKESERLCRELGHKDELAVSLTSQGNTLFTSGDLEGAWAFYAESETIARELGNREWLGNSISNQANILLRRGDPGHALALYVTAEQLFREIGQRVGLSISLRNQAQIYSERNDTNRALACYEEAERLCREVGDQAGLLDSLSQHAYLLYTRGDLAGAMSLQRESERLCREVGDRLGLARSLIHLAVMVGLQLGKSGEAWPMAEEAYQLAVECGDDALAAQVASIRGQIQSALPAG